MKRYVSVLVFSISFSPAAFSLTAPDCLKLGSKDDTLRIVFSGTHFSSVNPSGGALSPIKCIDGKEGTDTLVFSHKGKIAISSHALIVDGGRFKLPLYNFENVEILGGDSDDQIDVTGWFGKGSISGGGGEDTLIARGDLDYYINNSVLRRKVFIRPRAPRPPNADEKYEELNHTGFEIVQLTGGYRSNVLDAIDFSGRAILIGKGGIDSLGASSHNSQLFGFDPQGMTRADRKIYDRRCKNAAIEEEGSTWQIENDGEEDQEGLSSPDINSRLCEGRVTHDYFILGYSKTSVPININLYPAQAAANTISARHVRDPQGLKFQLPNLPLGKAIPFSRNGLVTLTFPAGTEDPADAKYGPFQIVEGSPYADDLTGNKRTNYLSGRDGNDILRTNGIDFLFGGPGQDQLDNNTPFRYQHHVADLPSFRLARPSKL